MIGCAGFDHLFYDTTISIDEQGEPKTNYTKVVCICNYKNAMMIIFLSEKVMMIDEYRVAPGLIKLLDINYILINNSYIHYYNIEPEYIVYNLDSESYCVIYKCIPALSSDSVLGICHRIDSFKKDTTVYDHFSDNEIKKLLISEECEYYKIAC